MLLGEGLKLPHDNYDASAIDGQGKYKLIFIRHRREA